MQKAIVLNQADTKQGVIRRMTDDLGASFLGMGFNVYYWDANQPNSMDVIGNIFDSNSTAAIISMNLYSESLLQLGPHCTKSRVPVFFYCFDTPFVGFQNYKQLLDHFPDLVISLTGTNEFDAAAGIFGRPNNFAVLRQAVAPTDRIAGGPRDFDGLLIGNNINIQGIPMPSEQVRQSWSDRNPSAAKALNAMIEIHRAEPRLPVLTLGRRAIPPSLSNLAMMVGLLNEFDFYMRSKVREDAIAVLADHDVIICGEGWEHLAKPGQRARFMGSTPNVVCQDLMRRTKCLFNIVPEYYSCSERVLEAAMIGCPVVTSRSSFLEAEFGDCLLYTHAADDLPDLMAKAGDASAMEPRIAGASAIVRERHTWNHRAATIIDILAERGFPLV
ncbi:MAG: glycosyltransferase family 1 protein [Magnetospirillum sp.]|nr:glycosyltransferase family 1 protein [Magnetospirillum sp.]